MLKHTDPVGQSADITAMSTIINGLHDAGPVLTLLGLSVPKSNCDLVSKSLSTRLDLELCCFCLEFRDRSNGEVFLDDFVCGFCNSVLIGDSGAPL